MHDQQYSYSFRTHKWESQYITRYAFSISDHKIHRNYQGVHGQATHPHSYDITPESLAKLTDNLLNSSLSLNSKKTYRAAYKAFANFHRYYFKTPPPRCCSVQTLKHFIAYCHAHGCKYSTILTRVSAISYINQLNGFKNPSNCFMIKQILRGCKRSGISSDQRKPFLLSHLKSLITVCDKVFKSKHNKALFKAMFAVAFFALLRISEMTRTRNTKHAILTTNVSFEAVDNQFKACSIILPHYKHSSHPTVIQLAKQTNLSVCPILLLQQYLHLKTTRKGYLFTRHNKRPVSDKYFRAGLRKCIKSLKWNVNHYTSHSFRIGGATHAQLQQQSDSTIQQLGRWKSNAFRKYLRPPVLSA